MKRRGFFGLMGGAVVAGPKMVKEAAASTLADLNVGAAGFGMAMPPSGGAMASGGPSDWASDRFNSWQKLVGNADWLRRKRREHRHVQSLDPDLASYHSFSLGAKIRAQQDRNFHAWIEHQGGWLQRMVDGDTDDF